MGLKIRAASIEFTWLRTLNDMCVLWKQALKNPLAVNRLMGHMDVCGDCCETFGTSVKISAGPHRLCFVLCAACARCRVSTIPPGSHRFYDSFRFALHDSGHARAAGLQRRRNTVPTADKEPPLFYVKNYQFGRAGQDEDSWDDDDDWGEDLLAKYADVLAKDKEVSAEDVALAKLNEVPKDDKDIIGVIRDWVNVIISDMGICPFSKNADAAGLPGECAGAALLCALPSGLSVTGSRVTVAT